MSQNSPTRFKMASRRLWVEHKGDPIADFLQNHFGKC